MKKQNNPVLINMLHTDVWILYHILIPAHSHLGPGLPSVLADKTI